MWRAAHSVALAAALNMTVAVAVVVMLVVAPVSPIKPDRVGAFPGTNGRIIFDRFPGSNDQILIMNTDGTHAQK